MLQRDVAQGIHRVEDAHTNWYIVEADGALTIVDTGVPTSWTSLSAALHELGRTTDDIAAVVLTHGHFDHLGFAERARSTFGVPVWIHENDVPLTHHPLQYAHESSPLPYLVSHRRALPIIGGFLATRAFWPAPVAEVRRYGSDGTLDEVPGSPRVVFTPGHTLGHCSLHFPDRDAVIAGDAVVNLNPYTGESGPQIVARPATADSRRALTSLDALAATGAGTVLTGHGEPLREGAERVVEQARRVGVT